MTGTVRVRDATEADLPGLLAIYNDVIRTSVAIYTEAEADLADRQAWFRARTGAGFPVLAASEPGGPVLGYGSYGDFRAWPPGYSATVEHSVHVRADARGRGLGPMLVQALLGRAAAAGKHVMIGAIDAANAASLHMHERLGFERAGQLREVGRKHGRWLDVVFVQRILGA